MSNEEIEAIVRDTIDFVREEFFETTKGERDDLADFLRERLEFAKQPALKTKTLGKKGMGFQSPRR